MKAGTTMLNMLTLPFHAFPWVEELLCSPSHNRQTFEKNIR